MVRKTLQLGDPRLKAPNAVIKDFRDLKVRQVISDLIETMRANGLIGMAAPQIGENRRIFVTEPRKTEIRTGDQTDELRIYINPKIVAQSKEEVIIYEGCGCVANGTLLGPVKRPKEITIEANDQSGKRFRLRCDGILGRVIQHEYDHMSGIEFIEKLIDIRLLVDKNYYITDIRNTLGEKAASVITVKDFSWA
jgi:peptide deformylase